MKSRTLRLAGSIWGYMGLWSGPRIGRGHPCIGRSGWGDTGGEMPVKMAQPLGCVISRTGLVVISARMFRRRVSGERFDVTRRA